MMQLTLRNKIKCKICKETIESKHNTDWQVCACGAVSVSGGPVHNRKHYTSKDQYEDLSEYRDFTIEELGEKLEEAASLSTKAASGFEALLDTIKGRLNGRNL